MFVLFAIFACIYQMYRMKKIPSFGHLLHRFFNQIIQMYLYFVSNEIRCKVLNIESFLVLDKCSVNIG